MRASRVVLPATIAFVVVWAQPAHAYVDPGTGSFAIQALFAGVLGALFGLKVYWSRLRAFGRKLFSPRGSKPE